MAARLSLKIRYNFWGHLVELTPSFIDCENTRLTGIFVMLGKEWRFSVAKQ